MSYRLAMEEFESQHWVAYALDLPGCFSSGPAGDAALQGVPAAIGDYFTWRSEHDCSYPVPAGPHETELVETLRYFNASMDANYIVNATFADDRRPLSASEIASTMRFMEWTRHDLLDAVRRIPAGAAGESVRGILRHVAGAENWYFSQLGLDVPAANLPEEPLARLEAVRANSRAHLPALAGSDVLTSAKDEEWTVRKIVRRLLWHERGPFGEN